MKGLLGLMKQSTPLRPDSDSADSFLFSTAFADQGIDASMLVPWEARANDRTRQDAAFASGAQYVSTDYMTPDPRFGAYTASLPGGGRARLSPAPRP